jgi:hypothetical protein
MAKLNGKIEWENGNNDSQATNIHNRKSAEFKNNKKTKEIKKNLKNMHSHVLFILLFIIIYVKM